MTVGDLRNIFLRLDMAEKADSSEFAFDAGRGFESPFAITGIHLDEDGDVCLESDQRVSSSLSAKQTADAISGFDPDLTIYFVSTDSKGESQLFNIKDGGTYDRNDKQLRMIKVSELSDLLNGYDRDIIFHLESGTINFTINSVYMDETDCLCLESNEIEELDDYTVGLILDELNQCQSDTDVYFYDDEAEEFYGIYLEEKRIGREGDLWIKAR